MAEFEFVEQEGARMEPRMKVIGVGGGGGNAVDNVIGKGLDHVEFYVVNTDAQALQYSRCVNKLQIGKDMTFGRGTGADPILGEKAALAAKDTIMEMVRGADIIFLSAGFGGGTGTGATPVIAEVAREMGILTIAVSTRPFRFEGPQRIKRAELGIARLKECCDTLVIISNERLLEVVGNKATLPEAFSMANDVLAQGVRSIYELITIPGVINVDFGDVKAVMTGTGGAVMGVGIGKGEHRTMEAVKKACYNPLIERSVIDGATNILMCITGGENLKLDEINQCTTAIYETTDANVNITLGVVNQPNLKDEVKVTIIATGFKEEKRGVAEKKSPAIEKKEPPKPNPAAAAPAAAPTLVVPLKPEPQPQPVTLKEKLESMLAAESKLHTEQKQKDVKEEQPDLFKDEQQDYIVNFNRPDNPLRRLHEDDQLHETIAGQEEPREDIDLDSPAFLRRRKTLFD